MIDLLRIFVTVVLLIPAVTLPAQDLTQRLRSDETLIIPGIGAEKLLLSDSAAGVASLKGSPDRTARFRTTEEIFGTIYKLQTDLKIPYDMIYYYNEKKCVVFLHDSRVSAIAGFSSNRVTDLSVDLGKGMDNFIFSYGNLGMEIKEKASNRACLFAERGIAVFDDGRDGKIDMYLIFRAREKNK